MRQEKQKDQHHRYLRAEIDLEGERINRRMGDLLRRRGGGSLLGGLLIRLGGVLQREGMVDKNINAKISLLN